MRAREAARTHLRTHLSAIDRAGVFTTSGTTTLEFTDDRAALDKAMIGIQPRSGSTVSQMECPPVTYYMADQASKGDPQAFDVIAQDAIRCTSRDLLSGLSPDQSKTAAAMFARIAISKATARGEQDVQSTLDALNGILSRMSSAPGQRLMVLISPGFYITTESRGSAGALTDKALRSNVVISTIDGRGLYTVISGGDAAEDRDFTNTSAGCGYTQESLQTGEHPGPRRYSGRTRGWNRWHLVP